MLLSSSQGPLALTTSTAERLDPGHPELELSGLSALAAERDLADQQAGDATALLETIKAARAGAVELSTRSAERARLLSAPPRELGQFLAAERGFTGEQWSCLDSLWQRESNWNPHAQNPSSGAYGIPQSLPGSKMATVAPTGAPTRRPRSPGASTTSSTATGRPAAPGTTPKATAGTSE